MDEILCQFGADILDTSDLIKILSFHQALHVFRLHISSGATCSGRALCRVDGAEISEMITRRICSLMHVRVLMRTV